MKTAKWAENAYKGTTIYWGKTQSDITKMLGELSITQTRFTNMDDRFILEFVVKLTERSIPSAVRIVVPLITKSNDTISRNRELNVIHRVLLNHLKSKFVAIVNGLAEFEQEFMSHLVVTDKSGRTSTLGESLLPQYKKNLEGGDMPQFLLGN